MDLDLILGEIENKEAIKAAINLAIGEKFVSKKDFNEKNSKVKELEKQVEDLNANITQSVEDKKNRDLLVEQLNAKIGNHEKSLLKSRVANEAGIPLEFAERLVGETEEELRKDAEKIFKIVGSQHVLPLRTPEEPTNAEDAPYKALLQNIKGE